MNQPNNKPHFSPLRYPGGKASLFPFIDEILKVNDLSSGTYIEPYAGGAGAALSLLLLEKVERIVINDFDRAIYAFWKAAICNSERFISKIWETEISIAEWRRQRYIYKNTRSSDYDLGFATFYLNRTNHSGILGGGPVGGLKQKGEWLLGARFNKEKLIERIKTIALYRSRIVISNMDGLDLLSTLKVKKKVFIYIDPPYYVKGSCLYLNHYMEKDHLELSNFLNKYDKLNWLLTYDNVDNIRGLYSKRRKQDFTLNYSARAASKGKEIMIFSDSLLVPN